MDRNDSASISPNVKSSQVGEESSPFLENPRENTTILIQDVVPQGHRDNVAASQFSSSETTDSLLQTKGTEKTNWRQIILISVVVTILTCSLIFCVRDFVLPLLVDKTQTSQNLPKTVPEDIVVAETPSYSELKAKVTVSRAHLYLDDTALDEKKLRWTSTQTDSYISPDLKQDVYPWSDQYSCIVVGNAGFYDLYSKVTFTYYDRAATSISHQVIRVRNGLGKMVMKNRFTAKSVDTYNYWPSNLHRNIELQADDMLCVTVSDLSLIYHSVSDNYVGLNKL